MDGALTDRQYLDHLERAVTRAAAVWRADLDVPVPSCPGWSLGDLAAHLGQIHRWALDSLTAERPPDERPAPRRDALLGWFDDGAAALLAALRAADPATPCWGFGPPPRTVRFWLRRQAHETRLHAWDAEAALGEAAPLDPALAADGLDEVAHVFYPRQVRLGRREPLGVAVALRSDDAGTTTVLGEGEPVATLTGPEQELLLALWRRRDLAALVGADVVRLEGDERAAGHVLSQQLTP